ncbi:MAG: YbaN family protein [Planctomycetota bacterium]
MAEPSSRISPSVSVADRPRPVRWAYAAAGGVLLTLGGIGVVVPGWPTTVFWLVAAWCFSKSYPPLQRWIYSRPRVGPVIAEFLEHRRLSAPNKRRAIVGIWLGICISVAILIVVGYPLLWVSILPAIAACVTTWLWWGVSSGEADKAPLDAVP